MFIHKIDEEVSLKLIELNDAERVFEYCLCNVG